MKMENRMTTLADLRVRKVSVVGGRNEAVARKADRTEIITPEKIGDRIGRNR
jgi:hypothetical protein